MYPEAPTHTEELIALIKSNSQKVTDIIKEYIEKHDTSKMDEGVRYYFNESDITKRQIYMYENDTKVVDEDATNNKLPTSWHKRIVDQKVGYLAGKPITIESNQNEDPALERIIELLGDEFEDIIPELIKNASNKGKEWLHPYIDENGDFDYMIVPAQEFIPIYDNTKRKNIIGGIRFYDLDDGTRKIELWDDQQVTFYEESEDGIVLDVSYNVNPQSHFYYGSGETIQGYGWGKIPFIEFRNNEEAVGDLTFYKQLIDAYELIISDVTNTLEDITALIYVLKGYEGTELEEFMTNLKKFKAISVSGENGSGVDTIQADIPISAVDSQTKRLAELIYDAGQAVDTTTDSFGQNPSGVALQFLYSFLDMKANVLERKFNKGLKLLMWFICEYLEIAENIQADYKSYSFAFNKSMVTNETEKIDNINNSRGLVSDETLRAKHPFVDDVQLEQERIEREKAAYAAQQEPLGGEDEDEPIGD
ncbi:SPP1 family phage portal protein [Cytobacillus horneckiae]|uniref:phage portal protein n=1 Tax=Cytobacillus horneckiae TaxID=549687 RepID=UPI0019D17BB8|nr:phage portal protein [Cytobacillus horneckiae]MBN6886235.1 phage portal protein [Cytobacillus horneckiae]